MEASDHGDEDDKIEATLANASKSQRVRGDFWFGALNETHGVVFTLSVER